MEKKNQLKDIDILKNAIYGWLMVWVAIITVWIKFDWVTAIVVALLVYGILNILSVSFLALVREVQNTNQL